MRLCFITNEINKLSANVSQSKGLITKLKLIAPGTLNIAVINCQKFGQIRCFILPFRREFLHDHSTLVACFGNFIATTFSFAYFSRRIPSWLSCHVRLLLKLSLTSQVPGYPCKCFQKDSMCWGHRPTSTISININDRIGQEWSAQLLHF